MLAELRENAFLTPEWCESWFRHFGDSLTPFVPALKTPDGRLRGLLPLALPRSGYPRTCRIAGANLGDQLYPVARPGDEPEVAAFVGEALRSPPEPWSVLAFDHVDLDAPWVDALAEATRVRLRRLDRTSVGMPLIELRRYEDWDAYLQARSSHLRSQIRKHARRIERNHAVRVRRTEAPGELEADMSSFFELHGMRFAGKSLLLTDRGRAFHRDFAAAALARGWLRLWFLELDEQPIATWYGWRIGDRYAFYNQGFNPEWSRLSPGGVLLSRVIESAFEERAREFDFLLGEEAYKFRYVDRSREVSDVTLARPLPHPAAVVTSAGYGLRRLRWKVRSWVRR